MRQLYADLTRLVRIGVFEGVRDPFGQHHAEIHAGVGFQRQGLQFVAQRRPEPVVVHRRLQVAEQSGQIFIESDHSHLPGAIEPLMDHGHGIDAGLGLVQSVFSGLVHHSLALEADKRGHKRQAVGDPVIDFDEQRLSSVTRPGQFGSALLDPAFQ